MKVSLRRDLQDTIARWSAGEDVEPSRLRSAIEHLITMMQEHAEEMTDGEVAHWSNVAGLMNRDLRKLETRHRLRSEGIECD